MSVPLVPGDVLGPYRLDAVLGEGAMGTVFRAVRTRDDREVALKVVRADLSGSLLHRQRFVHEARAASHVEHPNLVGVVDVGEQGECQYLAMDFVAGLTLDERIEQRGALPVSEAVRVVGEIASALQAIHDAGLVHRDVKPSNIILRAADGSAALSDFGLARGSGYTNLTRPGQVVGTLGYLAPECISGERGTPSSDVYALGCVAVECLSGRPPFAGGPLQVGLAHLEKEPPDPLAGRTDAPAALSAAVLTALSKQPADRPASARRYVELLHEALRPEVRA